VAFKPRKFIDKQGLIINTLMEYNCEACNQITPIVGRSKYSDGLLWDTKLICRECFLSDPQWSIAKPVKKAREHCILQWFIGLDHRPRKRVWMSLRLVEESDEHSS
jgi:hypothetical protein